jgi:hypothetical protein
LENSVKTKDELKYVESNLSLPFQLNMIIKRNYHKSIINKENLQSIDSIIKNDEILNYLESIKFIISNYEYSDLNTQYLIEQS